MECQCFPSNTCLQCPNCVSIQNGHFYFSRLISALALEFSTKVQLSKSSRAKHGGAYFSAVYGSIEDPMAAPGPYENLGPPFLGGSAQPVTFVLPLTHAHTASVPQRALQQDLFWNRSNVFVTKQIHETCFRTNPAGMPIDER